MCSEIVFNVWKISLTLPNIALCIWLRWHDASPFMFNFPSFDFIRLVVLESDVAFLQYAQSLKAPTDSG